MRNLSYLVPTALIAAVAVWARPSWWAVALLAGGAKFAWDWLWGDRRLLVASYGLQHVALGGALFLAGLFLAQGLGMDLAEFQQTARGLRKREAFLYHLPAVGIGVVLYGLLIWSRAWSKERE